MYFAVPAALLVGIIPYSKVGMKTVNHRLNAVGMSLETAEKRKRGLVAVDEKSAWEDLENWRKKNLGRALLAGVAGVLGGIGMAQM